MWELELIPVYLLLSVWGGKKRLYSATKFILYTAGGSVFLLIGVLGIGLYGSNEPTLNLEILGLILSCPQMFQHFSPRPQMFQQYSLHTQIRYFDRLF
ncbi:hypothetical protein KPL70_000089 [Citrus sinensis]|nr:hypothetical protein KPL70_000089 [Citrus sinensis]